MTKFSLLVLVNLNLRWRRELMKWKKVKVECCHWSASVWVSQCSCSSSPRGFCSVLCAGVIRGSGGGRVCGVWCSNRRSSVQLGGGELPWMSRIDYLLYLVTKKITISLKKIIVSKIPTKTQQKQNESYALRHMYVCMYAHKHVHL